MVYNLDGRKTGILESLNPLSLQNELVQETYDELLFTARENPDRFISVKYLKQIEEKLNTTNSYLILKIRDTIAYRTNDENHEAIEDNLPEYQPRNTDIHTGLYVSEPEDFLIRQVNFRMSRGQQGSVYILCDLDASMRHYANIVICIAIGAICILVLTNMAISRFIKMQFIQPLLVLEEGIDRMKCGNLDEDIPIISEDEIGEVALSFNQMRDRMKQSVEDRLRYEEENRILISNISHDLKTPITAIKGYVEGIIDGVATTPEMVDRYIKTIYNKAEAMDSMINELAIYSKIDSDTIPYDFKKLNLNGFFLDCLDDLSVDMESKNVEMSYNNYCPKNLNIIADPEQLRRVITNIIMNAVKYNDKETGRIHICIRPENKAVRIEIEDNGMGIEEKDLPFIFNRLYRADASRSSKRGGTGLGLSIAKKIIEEHGGKIWAKSRINIGTTIIFTLEAKEGGTE
ncbi:MAG: HAMP domain-containing sensor histidine kinase [Lachnospiraceae bacterium]|nr:HAMP domain-containing sensor histidine kinase [Lachnospiraceae bacterium]